MQRPHHSHKLTQYSRGNPRLMLAVAATSYRRPNTPPCPFPQRNISKACLPRCGVCVLVSRNSFPCHAMRVSPPRLRQLVHLLSVNPAASFMHKTMFIALRRRRNSFDSRTVMPSPTSPGADAKFDVETVPDDRTLVDSRRHSTPPDDDESISFSDVREDSDEVRLKSENPAGDPFISSKLPSKPVLLPIIYPLPSAEDLLAHGRTPSPPTSDAAPITPLSCISRALSPPPTHYKRKRARVITSADHDIDPDQTSIRWVRSLPYGRQNRC